MDQQSDYRRKNQARCGAKAAVENMPDISLLTSYFFGRQNIVPNTARKHVKFDSPCYLCPKNPRPNSLVRFRCARRVHPRAASYNKNGRRHMPAAV